VHIAQSVTAATINVANLM